MAPRIHLGPCPRCGGQLEDGVDGPQCIHCGHGPELAAPLPVEPQELVKMTRLKDEGCEESRSCFDCPLPACKYELVAA